VAGYTKRNLIDEVDDSAQKFGMGEVLEAHFARDDLECTKLGISLQRLKPGARMPFGHRHGEQEEVYVVVIGNGRLKLDDETIEVRQGDAVRVSPEVMRAFEAGPEGLELLAVGAPAMRDTEQEMGWWSD
jgi:mannose-6-phosphate isomerase-like protein (cupin superfamily)